MLKLQNIKKVYVTGDTAVTALDDVSITFRKSEFVSVLGPSGCGKTTLLNIIGGLDRYTAGDLSIDGISTKEYADSDWDTYRNHSIGFVFQSYNLIPHQSVLANVELALTLSGVSREARRARAKAALEQVGLGDQLHKKPTQMSGGQMQRVAIARALVNNPEILLADEPTGALDSETSVQIMELLKEVSKDRLVIMVTHNPELAEQYSSRIIRLLDGKIVDDTNPYTVSETTTVRPSEQKKAMRKKGTSMSFLTALSLSFNNLLTKKARTILTSFAGSIGIIGIALILALSTGVQNYINQVQEDTLSSYPITIEAETVDLSALLAAFAGQQETETEEHDLDKVYGSSAMYDLVNSLNKMQTQKNNLTGFKAFLEAERGGGDSAKTNLAAHLNAIQYVYNLNLNVLVKDTDGNVLTSDINELMQKLMARMMGGSAPMGGNTVQGTGGLSSLMNMSASSGSNSVWQEMISDGDDLVHPLLKEQYDIVSGAWPTAKDEVVLVINSKNEISDFVLYALGLKTEAELMDSFDRVLKGEQLNTAELTGSWSFDEILGLTFRAVPSADFYYKSGNGYADVRDGQNDLYTLDNIYNTKGTELKIVGIIRQNPDASAGMLQGSICYTKALTESIITDAKSISVLQTQLADPTVDIFTGLPFADPNAPALTTAQKAAEWNAYLASLGATASPAVKAAAYKAYLSAASDVECLTFANSMVDGKTREEILNDLATQSAQQNGTTVEAARAEIDKMLASYPMTDEQLVDYVKEMYIAAYPAIKEMQVERQLTQQGVNNVATLSAMYDQKAASTDAPFTDAELAAFFDNEKLMPPTESDATYKANLEKLGCVDMASPKTIHIYATTFEAKEAIADIIENTYNASVTDEDDKIEYTDYVALLMSSITIIIDAISYVLIAFVSISLVVSSIMIGIITYISVLERTKEIGILRSIGASKRDVSRVFNAETLIVGFGAGAMGILITLLLCVIANIILHAVTGIASLNATLPLVGGIILVLLSMLLTLIAGLLPSRIAAKKDPVVALRTE